MGSADPPLAVHCLYGGGHRQPRRRGTEEVYLLGGPLGAAPARLAPVHRSVLVRAAVCHQVGQRATHRLNGWPAARRRPNDIARRRGPGGGHRRALGALVLLLAPHASHARERLTAHRRRFRSCEEAATNFKSLRVRRKVARTSGVEVSGFCCPWRTNRGPERRRSAL